MNGWDVLQGLGVLIGGAVLLATVAAFGIDGSVSSAVLARDGLLGLAIVTVGVALLLRGRRFRTE